MHLTEHEKTVLIVVGCIVLFGSSLNAVLKSNPKAADFLSDEKWYTAVVNVNRASFEELRKVPYLGEKTARRIVDRRRQKGRFESLDQLKADAGIEPRRYEKIKKYLRI